MRGPEMRRPRFPRRFRRHSAVDDGAGIGALVIVLALVARSLLAYPLALVGLATVVVLIVVARLRASAIVTQRLRLSGIATIDNMNGVQFERRLAQLFTDLGYRVRQTKTSGDYGADLLIDRPGQPLIVVQSKCYAAGRSVGVGAIQEVLGAVGIYGARHGLVVTNRTYTEPARRLAAANRVTLWDRATLIEQCAKVTAERSGEKQLESLTTSLARHVGAFLRRLGVWITGARRQRVQSRSAPHAISADSWREQVPDPSGAKRTDGQ